MNIIRNILLFLESKIEALNIADVGESSCNCYADQWDKREDNTIYCTGCGKDV